jgi:FKBP-type peptidyl-prolyl cis-trans isomerase
MEFFMFAPTLARLLRSVLLLSFLFMTTQSGNALASAELDYLEANRKKSGVMVTQSGLQYRVLQKGSGRKPSVTDAVEVHYKGSLITGKVFDSSYARGQSISFPLNRVIAGWMEGLQLMNEGAKYELVIPSNLGYGTLGAGNSIPANATLIFVVELLKVH